MRPATFPDPRRQARHAGIFASDLRRKCEEAWEVFAPRQAGGALDGLGRRVIRLPITVPLDEDGLVLLNPGGAGDAERRPATMEVSRPDDRRFPYRFGIGLTLVGGGPMRIPGVNRVGRGDAPPEPVHELTFALADDGFAVVAYGREADPLPLKLTEDTAGLLATALLITLGVKLVKAERGLA